MKLFVFTRYQSAHREDGFAIIAAQNREQAEHIMAERFFDGNHDVVQNWSYCRLLKTIEGIPDQPGLLPATTLPPRPTFLKSVFHSNY